LAFAPQAQRGRYPERASYATNIGDLKGVVASISAMPGKLKPGTEIGKTLQAPYLQGFEEGAPGEIVPH